VRDPARLARFSKDGQAYCPGRDYDRKTMLAVRRIEQSARTSSVDWSAELTLGEAMRKVAGR